MEHGNVVKACLLLEEGVRINPGSGQLRAFLALAVSENGDHRKAEELLDEAELLDPQLDVVEMYRLLLNINKPRKLPAVSKTRKLSTSHKTKQPGLKNSQKRASKQ